LILCKVINHFGAMKTLFYLLVAFGLIAFIYWIGWGSLNAEKSDLVLLNEEVGSLERISSIAPPIRRDFTLVNKSDSEIIIAKVYTDCSCLFSSIPSPDGNNLTFGLPKEVFTRPIGTVVKKGEEVKMSFEFRPGGLSSGFKQYAVFVETKSKLITKVPITVEIVR